VMDAKLNGISWDKNWIDHSVIQSGGNLSFKMSALPNKARGTKKNSFPFSLSN